MGIGKVFGLGGTCVVGEEPEVQGATSIEGKRKELYQRERAAREILRRLDYPSGALDRIWTLVSYVTGHRQPLRAIASRELEQIAEARRVLGN